jgi:hypothetical protein
VSVEPVKKNGKLVAYRVRWRDAGHNRSKTYSRHGDAKAADAEIIRRKRLGTLAEKEITRARGDAPRATASVVMV